MATQLNSFEIVQAQIDTCAKILKLDPQITAFLKSPMRELHFSIPVRMDDGSIHAFRGYRVQHNITRGPAKGGVRFHHDVNLDEVFTRTDRCKTSAGRSVAWAWLRRPEGGKVGLPERLARITVRSSSSKSTHWL